MNKITAFTDLTPEIFTLSNNGVSNKEIAFKLGLTISQVSFLKKSSKYKEIKKSYESEIVEKSEISLANQCSDFRVLCSKAAIILDELMDSENEKIRLDTVKYVFNCSMQLENSLKAIKISELEESIAELSNPDENNS